MTHRNVLETWFRRVWHEEELSAIDEMLSPDAKVLGIKETSQMGPGEFRPFAEAMLALIGNIHIEIKMFMEDGDWCCALIAVSATARQTGQAVNFDGQVMVRMSGGQLVEGYNHLDFICLYEQLGLMPEATLSHCLSGAQIQAA